jgi:prepilin-type processing-associated H-X9-DG protein
MVADPFTVVVAYETISHQHRYTATLYADGHVALVDALAGDAGSDGTNSAQ